MSDRTKGRVVLFVIYLIAFGLGFWVSTVSNYPILLKSAIAVGVTVTILFLGSLDFNNSSIFDPYWSVAPPLMFLYYLTLFCFAGFFEPRQPPGTTTGYLSLVTGQYTEIAAPPLPDLLPWYQNPRLVILFALLLVYSYRLTSNFLQGWKGLKHEDWRYVYFREKSGKAYWLVSFFAIHTFPALMVFGGTLSLWAVVVHGSRPLNGVDFSAILLTAGAILLEAVADRQLHRFIRNRKDPSKTMKTGLWSLSRHPNYLGEILFWWGISLFTIAANPLFWWVLSGPAAITLMFLFASIPMIEKRMLLHYPDYREYRQNVPMLVPWKIAVKQLKAGT